MEETRGRRRVMPLSYKEKLLAVGGSGFLVNHSEEDDIVHGWKTYFAKMNAVEEEHGDKDDSDEEATDKSLRKSKWPILQVTKEQYASWCRPWMNSLIVKLLGATIPKHIIRDRIATVILLSPLLIKRIEIMLFKKALG
ncbi:uncharacterized protein LOC114738489 [Neltuma alba]|uniref:uncharacterized protein LOC114738489 n=1 Tax=Neltuma alba TaxID=207710 RepID=UPI0010A4395A|nr:uncharacterized protein LOC114738489 [Prosopis alba]